MGKVGCHLGFWILMMTAGSWAVRGQNPETMALAQPPTNALPSQAWSFPEIEDLFLTGKISARQFQYYISHLPSQKETIARAPVKTALEKLAPEQEQKAMEVLRKAKPDPAQNPPPGPAIKPEQLPPLTPDAAQPEDSIEKDFSGIETKVDELLMLKKEREKTEEDAITTADDPALDKGKSKRERLDALLRLYINGKLSQADYNEKRKTVIAEPD